MPFKYYNLTVKYQVEIHTGLNKELSKKLINDEKRPSYFNFFHSPAFFKLSLYTPLFKPLICVAINDNKELLAYLLVVRIRESNGLKGWLSERAVVYGGPIFFQDNNRQEILYQLLQKLNLALGRKVVFTQFRNFYDSSPYDNTFNRFQYSYRERLNLIIDCRDKEKCL